MNGFGPKVVGGTSVKLSTPILLISFGIFDQRYYLSIQQHILVDMLGLDIGIRQNQEIRYSSAYTF